MPIFNWNFNHRPDPQAHLAVYGLRISVEIAVHPAVEADLIKKSLSVPATVSGNGIIDTGATITSIDERVANKLGLVQLNTVKIGTAQGTRDAPVYAFQMTLSPGLVFPVFGLGCD